MNSEVGHDEARHQLTGVDVVILSRDNCFRGEAVIRGTAAIDRLVEAQDLKPGDRLAHYEVPRG